MPNITTRLGIPATKYHHCMMVGMNDDGFDVKDDDDDDDDNDNENDNDDDDDDDEDDVDKDNDDDDASTV